jgi:hypothetical protein
MLASLASPAKLLANVGKSGESQHFLGFGHFLLAKFAKFAKFAKLQSLEILNESSMLKRLNELLHSLYLYLVLRKKVLTCFGFTLPLNVHAKQGTFLKSSQYLQTVM